MPLLNTISTIYATNGTTTQVALTIAQLSMVNGEATFEMALYNGPVGATNVVQKTQVSLQQGALSTVSLEGKGVSANGNLTTKPSGLVMFNAEISQLAEKMHVSFVKPIGCCNNSNSSDNALCSFEGRVENWSPQSSLTFNINTNAFLEGYPAPGFGGATVLFTLGDTFNQFSVGSSLGVVPVKMQSDGIQALGDLVVDNTSLRFTGQVVKKGFINIGFENAFIVGWVDDY